MQERKTKEQEEPRLYLDQEMEDTVTLILGEEEVECGIVASFPAGGRDYVALLPLQQIEGLEEDEILLYAYTREGEDFNLIEIQDDEEFDLAADAFDELLDEAAFQDMEES